MEQNKQNLDNQRNDILAGRNPVMEAIRSGRSIESILVAKGERSGSVVAIIAKAKQKNIPAQVILQNYMFERLLVRLSASGYKEKFVLKGGMLVAAIVGLDNRATMDMDTTLKNLPTKNA